MTTEFSLPVSLRSVPPLATVATSAGSLDGETTKMVGFQPLLLLFYIRVPPLTFRRTRYIAGKGGDFVEFLMLMFTVQS